MNLKELFEETTLLPIDKKLEFIDLLLDSIQNSDLTNQKEWIAIAQRRLEEIQSGKVEMIDLEATRDLMAFSNHTANGIDDWKDSSEDEIWK